MSIMEKDKGSIMNFEEKLNQYAKLIARCGIHVEEGQPIVLQCPVLCQDFARQIVHELYEAGASEVIVHWTDDKIARMRYDYAPLSVLETVPQWRVDSKLDYVKANGAYVSITGSDPECFKGVNPVKLKTANKANEKANKEFFDLMMRSAFKWNVSAVPTEAWAKKVYPDVPVHEAVAKLWEAIFNSLRIGDGDPVERWDEHGRILGEKCRILNTYQFKSLHYQSANGTDFYVELPKNHRWEGGADTAANGIKYFANMPTEEVFTMPERTSARGTLVSSLPLCYDGELITDFTLTFEGGKVVAYTAKEGEETLKRLLEMDEGSAYLGEVALVPVTSPVKAQNVMFYNTLFDENAACHLALGACYPTNVAGGAAMSEEELKAAGGNVSSVHEDFMVGTEDLSIVGTTWDGEKVQIFKDGNWAI